PPSRPEMHEMPRDFFKELAVFTILKQRQFAQSKLYFNFSGGFGALGGGLGALGGFGGGFGGGMGAPVPRKPSVEVLETGLVGSLDYKILKAGRADDLFTWLKTKRYQFSGDEAARDYYV